MSCNCCYVEMDVTVAAAMARVGLSRIGAAREDRCKRFAQDLVDRHNNSWLSKLRRKLFKTKPVTLEEMMSRLDREEWDDFTEMDWYFCRNAFPKAEELMLHIQQAAPHAHDGKIKLSLADVSLLDCWQK